MSLYSSAPMASATAGDTTNADFTRALSQPLLIQSPLQMMLETLFFRSRDQGAIVLGAQEQLKMLAAENAALRVKLVEQEQAAQLELQDLRKFCIASQEKNTAKDSQAYTDLQQQQQEIINHISTVEAFASQADASMQRISTRLDKEFKFRLDTLSLKLHGVDNLLGHQLAVHEMADILGVAVAQTPVQPAGIPLPSASESEATEEAAEASAAAAARNLQAPSVTDDSLVSLTAANSMPPNSDPAELPPDEPAVPSETSLIQTQASLNVGHPPSAPVHKALYLCQGGAPLSRGGSGSASPGLLPQLKTQVEALEDKELELRLHVEMLRDDMGLIKKETQTTRADLSDASAVTSNVDARFHMLESELRGLWKKITDAEAAQDRAAASKPLPIMPVIPGKAGDNAQGVSIADLCVLQDQIRASFDSMHDLKERLDKSDLQTARFQSSCMAAAATAAGEARAITNSFQGQLASMHQDMQSLQTKVDTALASVECANEDMKKCASAVDDLAHKVRHKLGPEDWTRITQRAAGAAEAALQQGLMNELQRETSPAGASRFRCLSCDTDLRLQRSLQQGRPPGKPPLLPRLLAPDATSPATYNASAQTSDPGAQYAVSESLRHRPRTSASPDAAAYASVFLPELPIACAPGRSTAPSPTAPLGTNTSASSLLLGPGNAAMPPSIAARASLAYLLPGNATDMNQGSIPPSGLPKQIDGAVVGDRRSHVLQHVGMDRRAWQAHTAKDRPATPIFTV